MTKEEIDIIEKILEIPPNENVRQKYGLKDKAELVAFMCAVTGVICKLSEQGKLPLSTSLDGLAAKVRDIMDMMRPNGPAPQPPKDPNDIN